MYIDNEATRRPPSGNGNRQEKALRAPRATADLAMRKEGNRVCKREEAERTIRFVGSSGSDIGSARVSAILII